MEDVLRMIKENKRVVIIVSILLTCFIAWSAWQYVNRLAYEEAVNHAENQEQIDGEPTGKERNEAKVNLTDRQKELISRYQKEQKEFVELLKSSIWTDASETASLSFSDESFTEIKGKEKWVKPFAVEAVTKDRIDGEGSSYESYLAAITTDADTLILNLRRWIQPDGTKGEWNISSEKFQLAKEYVRSKAAEQFELKDLEEEAAILLGGKEKLTAAAREYAVVTYPTAAAASWNKKVEFDWQNQTIKTWFHLDTSSSSQMTVVYRMDTKTYVIN